MKDKDIQTLERRLYQSPALTIMQVETEGLLCESTNRILDLDYIYDEYDKE